MSRDERVWGRHHPLCGRMFLICAILSCGSWILTEWSDCQEKTSPLTLPSLNRTMLLQKENKIKLHKSIGFLTGVL